MNKRAVDLLLPKAYISLYSNTKVVKDINGSKVINKTFQGQIATFGAAISMGTLLSAIAFFSMKGSSSVDRDELMKLIHVLVDEDKISADLFTWVTGQNNEKESREKIVNAAVALKLAMNLFVLEIKDYETNNEEPELFV